MERKHTTPRFTYTQLPIVNTPLSSATVGMEHTHHALLRPPRPQPLRPMPQKTDRGAKTAHATGFARPSRQQSSNRSERFAPLYSRRFFLYRVDSRQFLSLQHLETGPAAGGDVRHLVAEVRLLHGSNLSVFSFYEGVCPAVVER